MRKRRIEYILSWEKITAKINKLEIDEQHPYVSGRGSWEEFVAERLYERLIPLVKNNIITVSEINRIADDMRLKKAAKTRSFIHLDMRFINMIYYNGNIFILDAENCEFGDPLFDLALIDLNNNLTTAFLNGYKSITGTEINLDCDLSYYYKMERQALVLDLYMNEIINDEKATHSHLASFSELKNRLLL